MGASLRGAPRRRSAYDQLDPPLFEGRHPGRRRGLSKRGGNPTRRFDQRHAEQRVSALCTRPMVRARGQTPVAGRGPHDQIHRRLCDVFPISRGCPSRPGRLVQTAGKVRPDPGTDQLVEFWRFAQRHSAKHGRKRPETIYFLGFTLYCTRNLKGNFRIGMRTEKSRLRRSLMSLQDLLRRIRHLAVREQVNTLNAVLRGHYAYYGIAGNFRSLQKVHRAVERYWHKMLCSRSWAGRITWDMFHQIKQRQPILRPKLYLPYRELQALAML